MDAEQLDEILNASAWPARAVELPAIRSMMADAAEVARPARTRRRVRAGVAAGAALALMIGGGGVAVASGLVSWPTGFEDPDGSYAFTLPSGRGCEVRLIIEDQTDPAEPSPDDAGIRAVQESVATWLREGALDRDLDLGAADAEAARILAEQEEEYRMTVLIGADGWLTDAAVTPGRPDADDARAFAVDRAVRAAMGEHLLEAGFPDNTWTGSTNGGVKCEAE
ncbi:hypothetical protein [Microbacterium sp. SD291]|uniref:hypothetical protein n=1 Tax=Microbacterium sp. SD291 TaxID=2782007 RepID=UPI001A97D131|nr:hypothetical protein [Microbacterium sp. SD291]MBO0979440.1 hypothetical protein [Microbacterium sp. SD291]